MISFGAHRVKLVSPLSVSRYSVRSDNVSQGDISGFCCIVISMTGICAVCSFVHSDTGLPLKNTIPNKITVAIRFVRVLFFHNPHKNSAAAHAISAVCGTTVQIHTYE